MTDTMNAALEALRLHVAYEKIPADRGGKDGPKGKAWAAFIAARDAALASTPTVADDEPMLTQAEQDELVGRINANPNLHPVADDGKLVERFSRWLDYVTSNSNRRVGEPSTDDYRRLIELAAERIAARLEQHPNPEASK